MTDQIRLLGYAVFALGALLLIASLLADPLALGQPGTGFGWKQISGTIVGAVLTFTGYRLANRQDPHDETQQHQPPDAGATGPAGPADQDERSMRSDRASYAERHDANEARPRYDDEG